MKIAGTVNMTDSASITANQMNLYGEEGLSAVLSINNSNVSVRDFIQVGHADNAERKGVVSLFNATVDTTVNVSAAGTVNVSKDSTVTNINNAGTVSAAGDLTSENITNSGNLTVAPGVKLTAATVANNGEFTIDGGKFDIETLVNDGELSSFVEETAKSIFGEKCVFNTNQLGGKAGGSEDFAYISQQTPSVMVALCAGEKADGYEYPLHHEKTRFDENALPVGAAILASVAANMPR
jgi:metal-dependent amidase/aminoacylase/carboxypeptidase family protein